MRRTAKINLKSRANILSRPSGFTLVELIVALIGLGIILLIAIPTYIRYVDKARLALAVHLTDSTRDNLVAYHIDRGKFPDSIDFDDCLDEEGRSVFSPSVCDNFKNDISSVEYTFDGSSYILSVRANDKNKTLITLQDNKISIQDE